MKKLYYKIPFDFKNFFEKNEFKKINLQESISQFIGMIITTTFGEYKYDNEFGSEIWETDFDHLTNINILKERIKNSLFEKIIHYEKRLSNIEVQLNIIENKLPTNSVRIKKRLKIIITGTIQKTHEPYVFSGDYYLAPLSYI